MPANANPAVTENTVAKITYRNVSATSSPYLQTLPKNTLILHINLY